jgi:hypothetical protein
MAERMSGSYADLAPQPILSRFQNGVRATKLYRIFIDPAETISFNPTQPRDLPPWIIPELKLELGQSQSRDPGGA